MPGTPRHLGRPDEAAAVVADLDEAISVARDAIGDDSAVAAIESDPLWQRLPAVVSGDVIVFDRLGYPGAVGQIRFLGDLAAELSG